MATASDNSMSILEEGLTCCICVSLLREPKDLNCPHVFCLQCLKQWVKNKPTIECPVCRCLTPVPHGGLGNLKTNLSLKNMVDNLTKKANSKGARNQVIAPICPDHGERQQFFCVTCDQTACHKCLVTFHHMHGIKPLDEQISAEKTDLENLERKLNEAKERALEDVSTHARKLEKQKTDMIENIQRTFQKHMTIIEEKKTRWIRQPTSVTKIATRMNNLSLVHDDLSAFCFKPGSNFGELVSIDKTPGTSTSESQEPVLVNKLKLTYVNELNNLREAVSVVVKTPLVFAITDNVGTGIRTGIHVYMERNKKFELKSLLQPDNPHSFAFSSQGTLFISKAGVVEVFSSKGRYGHRYERSWPESIDVSDIITMTPDDLVVIGSTKRKMISVHRSDGELIRSHKVDCDVKDIASNGKHITFTTSDLNRGVLKHFLDGSILLPERVCVIDFETGHTLWTLDVSYIFGICYEQVTNALLVGRRQKKCQPVIEQYCCMTGRLISSLAGRLVSPRGMTAKDNMLVVADKEGVKLYKLELC